MSDLTTLIQQTAALSAALARPEVLAILSQHPDAEISARWDDWDSRLIIELSASGWYDPASAEWDNWPDAEKPDLVLLATWCSDNSYETDITQPLLSEPNLTILLQLRWKQPLSSSDKELLTALGKLTKRTVTYSSISC